MIRVITTPYKALCKAKDLYIRSITSCANRTTYGGSAITFGTQLPRSSSSSSSSCDEDLRELIRANSTTRMGDLSINSRADLDLYIKQHIMMASRRVPRSASVGMGRIDEEAPVSNFGDEDKPEMGSRKAKSDHLTFSRSKSTTAKIIHRYS
ncbi:Uncharacterized conserved protein UCP031279 [Cynara cardunculus var. scolymus]|uniref:Uncharacterized conserved protein UCP031279 n=2 Tax=Cynara cardunculus var. scolymus TaxID=59895 RepID=A0A103XXD9_CYNCS|nr:Uncharacterized conserved protein UCP031279 [Cynara cardunculus var. scolymus]